MHSFSCYFLLHHHFEAVTTSTYSLPVSSSNSSGDTMSDEPNNQDDLSKDETTIQIPENEEKLLDTIDLSTDSTINPGDEDSQFIYDSDFLRLICIGSHFDDIPQSIIEAYSLTTKILDLSKNRFRSLACIRHFPNLEELILDDNDLDDTHTRFPKLPNLHTLMLNKNRFQDIYKLVDQLRYAYPMLTHLSLLGNEACPYRIVATSQTSSNSADLSPFAQNRLDEEYQRYRHLLIFRIPTLKFLDASEISPNERRIAEQLGDILYSITEIKQSQSSTNNNDRNQENNNYYTPLPADTDKNKHRISVGKVPSKYNGEGSQGNKFVRDVDL
ncbi:unnamed protein product [Rotaria magnacalcarata]|uniref:Uncharacterized protein n=5 Tax=Rotaria magnacalcarata TaxID=392030 RepID=A0A816G0T9_9BILA|nr:unnamed protein product [Rotaria magnacalcarata]CAF1667848.1 unnamed protein product [Rotaria magnacalcarata]CAF2056244.1 unnamed protein product [Rotaria magnacalcarata]CAF2058467.1 unnamed protein product [Rotaria magnacalcarata]CAF3746246.1 unnamed protein product [Rotaria magnacalcarata]